MKSAELMALIGKQATDSNVAEMLQHYGASTSLKLKRGDTKAYVDLPKAGLYLIFTDEGFLEKRADATIGKSPLVLSNVTFNSSRIPTYSDFAEALPFGLNFKDCRTEVRNKLGHPELSIERLNLDRWRIDDRWIFSKYSKSSDHIDKFTVQVPDKT